MGLTTALNINGEPNETRVWLQWVRYRGGKEEPHLMLRVEQTGTDKNGHRYTEVISNTRVDPGQFRKMVLFEIGEND